MKLSRFLGFTMLAIGLAAGTAWGQNISTTTNSTTVGSQSFGFVPTVGNINTFMQTTGVTCDSVSAVKTCGTTNFSKVAGLPGAFTGNPFKNVSANPDFACGTVVTISAQCLALNTDPQTAPLLLGDVRQLVGSLTIEIDLGDGIDGMPDGSVAFTLDPVTGDATIDQVVSQTIDLNGAPMVFIQEDRTVGYNNAIGGALVPFVASPTATGLPANGTGLVSHLFLNQGGDGALEVNETVNFPVSGTNPGIVFPLPGQFLTPGLNTGSPGNPNSFP
jgi:hypothetical protein